jgi:hypothetical protein
MLEERRKISMANYYDLNNRSTHVGWYPQGKGGPIHPGGPSANAPVLDYRHNSLNVSVSGNDLTISPSPAGTIVTAIVEKAKPIPGAPGGTTFVVLIPDVQAEDSHGVAVHTVGVLSAHRGASIHTPGQLEKYTEVDLKGTASVLSHKFIE